jgi:hypothetical protein
MGKTQTKVLKSFIIDGKTFNIVEPNLQIVRESKYKFSKVFTDAIKAGFYTRKKLEAVLKEGHQDLITDHIEKRTKILTEMAETQNEIQTCVDPLRLKFLAELLRIYRETLFQEDLSMKSLFDSTADSMADEERINYLTFSLVRDEAFKNLWETFDEYLQDTNYSFIETCRYELMCWEYKIDPNWQDTLPESAAIQKAESIINDLNAEQEAKEITEQLQSLKKTKVKATKKKSKNLENKQIQNT